MTRWTCGKATAQRPVGAGAGDPLGRVPQPRTPSCPYLQGGQQSGQLGELLLEGLVLLLILAGGGAGSLVSQGRAARLPASPGTTGWGGATAPPALRTLPRQPPCALSLPAFLNGHWAVRSPGRGGARPGYLKGGWGAGRGPHSPLHSLQQQRPPLRQFVLGGTVCYRPGTPSPAAAQLRRSAGPQVHTGSPPSLQARLPEPAACLPASRCLGVPESSPQTPPPGGSPP